MEKMKFQELAAKLIEIEKYASRLKMTALLAELWRVTSSEEARIIANLIQGQLQPAYDSLEFSLSEKMIGRALARLVISHGGLKANGGMSIDLFGEVDEAGILEQVKEKQQQTGDWGEAVRLVVGDLDLKREKKLTVTEVYADLVQIAKMSGEGSQEEKLRQLAALYEKLDADSAKVVSRMVIGKLRLGFSLMTILDSLSWAATGGKAETKELEEIYQKKADVGLLVESYLQLLPLNSRERLEKLRETYQLSWGVPITPALCQRLNSSGEIIEKMEKVIAEPKYDGMRIQIHLQKNEKGVVKIKAFTRSLEDVSQMFPELWKLGKVLAVKEAIFDSEAVGFDGKTGKMLPFQETMTRRRKHGVDQKSQELPMKFFIFDILNLEGKDLINVALSERKKILAQVLPETDWSLLAPYLVTDNAEELHLYHQQKLAEGLEGAVIKQVDSVYQSGRKGWTWVKIKEEEGSRGKLNDTLDLVVMGYYFGKGKRHGFGVGAFLVGVPDEEGNFLTISKVGTGLSDEQFRELKQKSAPLTVEKAPASYKVEKIITPDVWLAPELVAEIAADEMTKSSIHTSGYGLRFPRLIRWRDDKTPEQATDVEQLKEIKIA